LVGPIDLLGQDLKSGRFVVIELKRDRAADRVFGQLSRYMGWVRKNLAGGDEVLGVIVAARIDDKLRAACESQDPSKIKLVEFESKMSIRSV
jgi:RecB family endonuclease NucS